MPDVLLGRDASFANHLGDGHIDDGNEVGDEENAVGDRSERAAGCLLYTSPSPRD